MSASAYKLRRAIRSGVRKLTGRARREVVGIRRGAERIVRPGPFGHHVGMEALEAPKDGITVDQQRFSKECRKTLKLGAPERSPRY